MRERFGRAHAPLHLIKAFGLSCVCFVSSLCVRPTRDGEGFEKPCISPRKGVRTFVFVFMSPFLVRSPCVFVLPCAPTHSMTSLGQRKPPAPQKGNEPLLGKWSSSTSKPWVFSTLSYSLVWDPRGLTQVTHAWHITLHMLHLTTNHILRQTGKLHTSIDVRAHSIVNHPKHCFHAT